MNNKKSKNNLNSSSDLRRITLERSRRLLKHNNRGRRRKARGLERRMKTWSTTSSTEEKHANRSDVARNKNQLKINNHALGEHHANQRGRNSHKSREEKSKTPKAKSQSSPSSSAALSSERLSKIGKQQKRQRSFKLRWRGVSVSLRRSTPSK